MTCNRCQPDRLCLNHAAEAKSCAFIRARDERDAIERVAGPAGRKTERLNLPR